MAAQFAGSRSLDERRRRRIAGGWDDEPTVPPPLPVGSLPETAVSRGDYTPRNRRRLPLQRVIPDALWKHACTALVLLAFGGGIFALEREAARITESLGPAAGGFVAAKTSRLLPFFSGVLLAASAELSLLIGWVRSRSRTDFSGRFRIWRWAAAAGFLLAATVMLDLHLLWSRTLIWRLQLDFAHAETLCWLAPAIGCGSVLLRDLLADIRNCRGSSTFLWLAVLSWAASVVVLLGGAEVLADAALQAVLVRAAAAFGHYCLFVSLLLQSRFVLFVSAEPPQPRRSRVLTALTATARYMLKPARGASRWRRRRKARRNERDTPAPAAESGSGTQSFVPGDFQDSRRASTDAAGKRTLRFDEPHELNELSGNGKKKSRRARKQQRDKSRASS